MNPVNCPICQEGISSHWRVVDGYDYFQCRLCKSIHIAPGVLEKIDHGAAVVEYSDSYWRQELNSARMRSYGSSLARFAEMVLYCLRPIEKFVDIGSGPGYLLDALTTYLPMSKDIFYGVERFPPPLEERTSNRNYIIGGVKDCGLKIDAGLCVEVVEHLTPSMLKSLYSDLAEVSFPNSLYMFNTGLPDFVESTDPGYMDPIRRGHIVSYGLKGIARLAKPFGFTVIPIPGKNWAYCLEYKSCSSSGEDIRDRIWTADQRNKAILKDSNMGELMWILGIETARAYP